MLEEILSSQLSSTESYAFPREWGHRILKAEMLEVSSPAY